MRLDDGRAVMRCEGCKEGWNGVAGEGCTAMYCRNMCKDRLAAYEDTGLEPEICAEYKKFEDEIVASGKDFNHLIALLRAEESEERELAQADALAELEALRDKVETQEQMAGEGRAALRQMEEKVAAAKKRLEQEKKKDKEREEKLRRELEEARKNPDVPEEVLQKLRAEVEEATSASVEKAQKEAQEAKAALEQARKDLALADGDMAVFKELFRRVQEDFGMMEDAIRRIGEKNAESAEKLRTAVQALVQRWAV